MLQSELLGRFSKSLEADNAQFLSSSDYEIASRISVEQSRSPLFWVQIKESYETKTVG